MLKLQFTCDTHLQTVTPTIAGGGGRRGKVDEFKYCRFAGWHLIHFYITGIKKINNPFLIIHEMCALCFRFSVYVTHLSFSKKTWKIRNLHICWTICCFDLLNIFIFIAWHEIFRFIVFNYWIKGYTNK